MRHGDSCIAAEASRTARRCEPLAHYVDAVAPYLAAHGVRTVFLATDSEEVIRDAQSIGAARGLTFLWLRNVSRTGMTTPRPTEVLDELIKRRATDPRQVWRTHRDALLGLIDTMLLARCDVLVGKFTSGLFRAAYQLSAARGGVLRPFVSLDAPWCTDYGVVSGYNEDFPQRGPGELDGEQVLPAEGVPGRARPNRGGSARVRDFNRNMFQC